LAKINMDLHKKVIGVSDEVMEIFMNYNWPGNVRELENLLVRACVVAQGQVLGKNDFPELGKDEAGKERKDDLAEVFTPAAPGKLFTLDEVEERYIRKVITENDKKNKGEICEILGVSRPTLERKLEKYGITFERD